jgi:gliding motility-associated-like protein
MKSLLIIPFAVLAFVLAANNPDIDKRAAFDKMHLLHPQGHSAVDTCLNLNLGPDANVCLGAVFTLNENAIPGNYTWVGSANLSCTDCPSPTFTATGTGTYIIACIVSNPICNDTDIIKINVLAGFQPLLTISPDRNICAGTVISLGGPSSPGHLYTWTSNPPGFSSTLAAPLPVVPSSSTTYHIKVTSPACALPRYDSVVVKVFQPPVIALVSTSAICLGDSALLGNTQVQAGVQYSWTPNNGTLNSDSIANPWATPQTAGLHQYVLTASNPGCTVTGQASVIATDLQLNLSVPDTISLCKGSSATIQVAVSPPGASIDWSPLQQLQITPDGLTGTVSPGSDFSYTIKATAAGCVKSKSFFVHVDSLPANLGVSPMDTSICAGSLVTLIPNALFIPGDFPGITFSWAPAIWHQTALNLPALIVKPLDSIVYQRITENGVCRDTVYARVNIIEPPVISIQPSISAICLGTSVELTAIAPGVDSLVWSPAASLSCNNCLSPTANPSSNTTYTLSGKFKGCPTTQTAQVDVIPPPIYQFPAFGTNCAGQQLQLNLLPDTTGAVFVWTSIPASAIPQVAQPTVTLNGLGQQSITYYLEANNGICSVRDSFKVQFFGIDLTVSAPDTICPQTTRLLTATSSQGGGQYSWSNGATTQAINVTPLQTTTYTVSYTLNGCTFQDSVQIVVQGQTPVIMFPTDVELCPGDAIVLNSVATPGATYSWTSSVGGFTSNLAIPPTQAPTQSTTYTVTATGTDGCSVTKKLDVTVFKATLSVSDDVMVCAGVPFTLSATGTATGTYLWTPDSIMAPSFTQTLNAEQTINYSVLYTYGTPGNECYLSDTVQVKVLRNFGLSIVADPDSLLNAGEMVTLDAIISPSQNLSGFTFNWLENNITNIGNTEQVSTTAMTADTSIRYTVVVVSPNGCSQTKTIRLGVLQPIVEYPNAFTPNNDGANDSFGLAVLEGIAIVESMEIFNRWGQKIYESQEPDARWDGRDAPSDIYVYKIRWRRSDGSLTIKVGEVTLLR